MGPTCRTEPMHRRISSASDTITTIRLSTSARRRLQDHQVGGRSPAEVIEPFMDEIASDHFRRDLPRALHLPREPLEEFRRHQETSQGAR